jgi:hypothetical protein
MPDRTLIDRVFAEAVQCVNKCRVPAAVSTPACAIGVIDAMSNLRRCEELAIATLHQTQISRHGCFRIDHAMDELRERGSDAVEAIEKVITELVVPFADLKYSSIDQVSRFQGLSSLFTIYLFIASREGSPSTETFLKELPLELQRDALRSCGMLRVMDGQPINGVAASPGVMAFVESARNNDTLRDLAERVRPLIAMDE